MESGGGFVSTSVIISYVDAALKIDDWAERAGYLRSICDGKTFVSASFDVPI